MYAAVGNFEPPRWDTLNGKGLPPEGLRRTGATIADLFVAFHAVEEGRLFQEA